MGLKRAEHRLRIFLPVYHIARARAKEIVCSINNLYQPLSFIEKELDLRE